MPDITFTVESEAAIKRLELDEVTHFVPIGHNNGVGHAELASGYEGVVRVYLQGQKGQTGKFKITQAIDQVDVTLAERSSIKITSDTGMAVSFVPFRVL